MKGWFLHHALQYRFYRRLRGGSYYLMGTALPMAWFWTEEKFTSCQAKCYKEEHWIK